jgi:hypothetical protein
MPYNRGEQTSKRSSGHSELFRKAMCVQWCYLKELGVSIMSDHLQTLIEAARKRPFPAEEREAQRRSFAYGNTKIENDLITRQMVDEQDEILKMEERKR